MNPACLAPLLVLLPVPCAAPGPGRAGAALSAETLVLPDGGTLRRQGDRIFLYDAKHDRSGFGYVRSDGSVDLFTADGTRKVTITPGVGGGPARVIVPRRR